VSARFETFGCRLNTVETEAMRGMVDAAADVTVINTCAVTAEAVRQARQAIRRARRERPETRIIVTGCAAQTDPGRFAAMPEVDRVIGNAEKLRPETWHGWEGRAGDRRDLPARVEVGDIMGERLALAPPVDGLGGRARAHLQVQTGCDHRCTFCIIPFGRGNSRSVPIEVVASQARRLRDRGFNEIVLTGVDLTSWGGDLEGAGQLGDLVHAVLRAVPDLPRLRLSSIDSVEIDPLLLDLIETEPRLMPHLHLSLQSGDDMILKRMKRRHRREDAIALCARLRARRPGIVFGADIIAGFPTETEAMFDNTMRLVGECGLTWLHVFPFSPRPGTPAARMPQLPGAVIRERAARLRALGRAHLEAHMRSGCGKQVRVLIEKEGVGRCEDFTPVRYRGEAAMGEIRSARVIAYDGRDLVAVPA
jgi:threonylcarbamoyladenosine tRNA methylthiotransferase MtaB